MKKWLVIVLMGLVMVPVARAAEETVETIVRKIVMEREWDYQGQKQLEQKLELEVTSGSIKGRLITVESGSFPVATIRKYKIGDKLLVHLESNTISDYVRSDALGWLLGGFVLLVIVVARQWGVGAIVGMAYSFGIIFKFILPKIASGSDPVVIAVVGAAMIVPVTFYISHGLGKKTHIAIVGTLISLVVAAAIASGAIEAAKLTGFGAEEAVFLQIGGQNFNLKGILLAGIIIGLLGVLDDITVAQASVVEQLKEANGNLRFLELFGRGMAVGHDHIASLVNTLVLVYAGSALPLLLLFTQNLQPFGQLINYEPVAEEIVRTLVGSIGLVLAVPVTTGLAAYIFGRKKR